MDEDIEFLQNFINYDRNHITELANSIPAALRQIGKWLRKLTKGPFIVIYRDEEDPAYELIQLLDGNNFEVEYGSTFMNFKAANIIPLYMEETIEIQFELEQEPDTFSTSSTYYDCEWILEKHNSILRGLRAKASLIDDTSFDEKLFDEFLKPPQRRKD